MIYGVQIEDKFLVLASMPRRLVFCGWSLPVIASGTPSPLQQVGSVRPGRWALGENRQMGDMLGNKAGSEHHAIDILMEGPKGFVEESVPCFIQ